MGNEPAIRVDNISKRYRVGENRDRAENLRDTIHNFFSRGMRLHTTRDLWALRNISFTLNNGDRLAIIGLNGAGKSTLLKIISKIVTPTEGTVRINGRIASLIEVGVGFHPDLSGHDNVYLNGMMLGMKRREIKMRYDNIVDFSEIGKFMETPVKHYSNGMIARLGFSIASHLDSEILIVDEVLSVGDYYFQHKCINRLSELCDEGRTILFVSHNLTTLASICTKGILLQEGEMLACNDINTCIDHYTSTHRRHLSPTSRIWRGQVGNEIINIVELSISGAGSHSFQESDTEACITIRYEVLQPSPAIDFTVEIINSNHITVATTRHPVDADKPGSKDISLYADLSDLTNGTYIIALSTTLSTYHTILHHEPSIEINIKHNLSPIYLFDGAEYYGISPRSWKWKATTDSASST